MNTVEILKRAKTLIERGWTQGYYARDENGAQIDVNDLSAATFCMLGACRRVVSDNDDCDEFVALLRLEEAIGYDPVPIWNDHPERTHQEVLDAFDRAIKIAKEREAHNG